MNSKKQIALFVTDVVILLAWAVSLFFLPRENFGTSVITNGLWLICVGFVPECVRIFRSIHGYATLNDEGITVCARGKTVAIPWREVKRVDIKGAKRIPIFDGLVIYGYGSDQTQVDYNFHDYIQLFRLIVDTLKKRQNNPIIVGKKAVVDRILLGDNGIQGRQEDEESGRRSE